MINEIGDNMTVGPGRNDFYILMDKGLGTSWQFSSDLTLTEMYYQQNVSKWSLNFKYSAITLYCYVQDSDPSAASGVRVKSGDGSGDHPYELEIIHIRHTVTFDPNNGEDSFTQQIAEQGHAAMPEEPDAPEGDWSFAGWYRDPVDLNNGVFDFAGTEITGNLSLTAVWTGSVKVCANDSAYGKVGCAPKGEEPAADTDSAEFQVHRNLDDEYTLTAVPASGYWFSEWQDADGNTVSAEPTLTRQCSGGET